MATKRSTEAERLANQADELETESRIYYAAAALSGGRTAHARQLRRVSKLLSMAASTIRLLAARG